MTTLKDIAQEAGVSITTVANVIHKKKSRVSPDMVAKIQEIIKRENYIPSMTARTLAGNTSSIIGVINQFSVQSRGGFFTDPFHNIFMSGIEARMREKGYYIMVRAVEDAQALETLYRNWKLAGMIFTGLFQDDFFGYIRSMNVPYVLIDSYIDLPEVHNVGLEDKKGGYLATKYLLERGHRVIAFVSPVIRPNGVVDQRFQGYKQALEEFDVPFDPDLVFEQENITSVTLNEGIRLGKVLSLKKAITGIFTTADIMAAGILAGLRDMGVNVPEDKSIIGFDDNYICQITYPRLTTIHQSADEKGIMASELLIAKLKGESIQKNKIILPVHLIERESVRQI